MTQYRVVHNNHYVFHGTVKQCSLEARLQPLNHKSQSVEFSQFVLRPLASAQRHALDAFGNHVNYFEISRHLQSFTLSAIHTVTTLPTAVIELETSSPWEQVAANEAALNSPYLTPPEPEAYTGFNPELSEYARASFLPDRPVLQAAYDLMQRIYHDFTYDPHATAVDTRASEAFRLQRGVCQDFSHIALACCRSLRLPARYVSGYVDTKAAARRPVPIVQDVSHAWFSVYDPVYGWVDFDPTNSQMPGESYITLAFGRDYQDVAPLQGQVDVQGDNRLKVDVDMRVVSE
jgi:transglutaminase-like putative cysteine protease